MRTTFRLFGVLLCALALSTPAAAQLRPGAFSTLTTTDTTADSLHVGCAVGSSTCTGGIKAGPAELSGHLVFPTDNTFDIGASGATRPRDLFLGRNAAVGGTLAVTGNVIGNVTFDTTTMFVDAANNRIGIGTITPGRQLTIAGATGPGLQINDTGGMTWGITGSTTELRIQDDSDGNPALLISSAGAFTFGAAATRWQIDTSGHWLPGANATYDIGASGNGVNHVFHADGTTAAPSMAFSSNPDTGFHHTSSSVYLSVDNADAFTFSGPGGTFGYTFGLLGGAFGAGNFTGDSILISRNTSGNGAAGFLTLQTRTGPNYSIWVDNTGLARITSAGAPQEDGAPSDTGGTVIGDQTSSRESKVLFGSFTDNAAALATILQTPLYNFAYKSGAYNGQEYVGIVTDESPMFGQDLGRSFNPITSFGYTVAAIKELQRQIDELKRGKP